jgi:hypothetical protein
MPNLVVPASLLALLAMFAGRPSTIDEGEPIEIVVETKKRPDWLFPSVDHPRVQAFFRSGSMTGHSLHDLEHPPEPRPLVRAGTVKVHGTLSKADRRVARRFARKLIDDVRPALEACYVDALDRSPTDATRLTFRVDLSQRDRGPVVIADGTLGDVYGNACAHGVLEFAEADVPPLVASLEIPVWFWLQTT